ncbi:MAG: porin [Thermodesulfobacteriota bacterium]
MKMLRKFAMAFAFAALAVWFAPTQSHAAADYNKGFVYESEDGMIKVKQQLRVQFRVDVKDSNRDNEDPSTDFMIRRAKLKFSGHAYEKWLKFGLQLAGDVGRVNEDGSAKSEELNVEDVFIAASYWEFADVKVGRYKIPFEREVLNSSSKLQFVDRSAVKEFIIDADRADGISTGGIAGGMVAYRVGLFQLDDETFSNEENVLVAGRVQVNFGEGELAYSSGSFTSGGDYKIAPNFAKAPIYQVGIGGFYYLGNETTVKGATYDALNSSGEVAGTRTSPDTDVDNTRYGVTADVAVRWERWNVEIAGYAGYNQKLKAVVNAKAAVADDVSTTGIDETRAAVAGVAASADDYMNIAYRAQAGFMIIPELEVAARYTATMYDYDDRAYEQSKADGNELPGDHWDATLGVNYYIAGVEHKAKVQVDFEHSRTNRFGISQLKENIARAQVQLSF